MQEQDLVAPVAEAVQEEPVHPMQIDGEPTADPGMVGPAEVPEPATPAYVYALGQVEARFPSLSVEKEFDQVSALMNTTGLTERQILKRVISDDQNRYLARSLCWLLLVQGLEAYILAPRDPRDYDVLIDAYREDPATDDVDVVIGLRGPIASPDMCNGVAVPIVAFDKLYSFTRQTLVESIPVPETVEESDTAQFRQTARGVFNQIIDLADNAGATDDHRALNYLVVRYPRIYAAVTQANDRSASLTGIEVRPSPLSGVRRIVEVIFSFTDRATDVVEKLFARVDVTEEYPFLVTKLGTYFER